MSQLADLIYSQMAQAGKPRTTTQQSTGTTTASAKSPLDLGSLGLLLYMMLSQGKNKSTLGSGALTGIPSSGMPGLIDTLPIQNYASASQQNPLALIMSLLSGIGNTGGLGGLSSLR